MDGMDQALRLLNIRSYSSRELAAKLAKKGFSSSEVENILQECTRLHLLNDREYALNYANNLALRNSGQRKIAYELHRKQLDREFVMEALEATGEEEPRRCLEAAQYKLRLLSRETDTRKRREKLLRYLAGRGFRAESVRYALEHLENPMDDN